MKKKRVIKPGTWWIVRFRQIEHCDKVTGYMVCDNAYHAGHSGFDRKWRWQRKKGQRKKVFKQRRWTLKSGRERRLAYRFADLADLKTSIKSKLVRNWMDMYGGILEVVQIEGCLFYNTVVSERVVDRRFHKDANEMEVLAVEHALGE